MREATGVRCFGAVGCLAPTPLAGESATSYASRLAACNEVDLATFCRHMGLRRFDVAAGKRHALDALADLGGVDPDTLSWDAIVRRDDGRWSLRGQSWTSGTLRRLRPRLCPLCAAEDIRAAGPRADEAAYARSAWSVEPIRTCSVHGIALADPAESLAELRRPVVSSSDTTMPGRTGLETLAGSPIALSGTTTSSPALAGSSETASAAVGADPSTESVNRSSHGVTSTAG